MCKIKETNRRLLIIQTFILNFYEMVELLIFWSTEFRLKDFLAYRVDQQAAIFASNSKLTLKIETLNE